MEPELLRARIQDLLPEAEVRVRDLRFNPGDWTAFMPLVIWLLDRLVELLREIYEESQRSRKPAG